MSLVLILLSIPAEGKSCTKTTEGQPTGKVRDVTCKKRKRNKGQRRKMITVF